MVIIGCIGAPYGIKGWVHVQSFTEPGENILNYRTWHLHKNEQWQEISVITVRAHGKGFVAAFGGCESREAAMAFNQSEIGILREELPPLEPGEYYWTDLIGMKVFTKEGGLLGELQGFLETGSNDVLIVQGEKGEYLIPYVPQTYVLEIDLKSRVMHVDWDPEF